MKCVDQRSVALLIDVPLLTEKIYTFPKSNMNSIIFFYYLKQHDVNNRLPDKLVENGVTFSNKKLCRYKIMKFFILREQMAKSFVWVTAGLALMEI